MAKIETLGKLMGQKTHAFTEQLQASMPLIFQTDESDTLLLGILNTTLEQAAYFSNGGSRYGDHDLEGNIISDPESWDIASEDWSGILTIALSLLPEAEVDILQNELAELAFFPDTDQLAELAFFSNLTGN